MNQRIKSAIWKTRQEKNKQTQLENTEGKIIFKNEDSLRDLCDNMMLNNIHMIEVAEGEERQQGIKNLFKEITENFPMGVKEKDT